MSEWQIQSSRIGNEAEARSRVNNVPTDSAKALFGALKYLYLSGKLNLQREIMNTAMPYLEPPERLMIRYLFNRSNGGLRQKYGHNAIAEAKASKFRCRTCQNADVRVLVLDHIKGRTSRLFRMLCANCHQIKSRENEWRVAGTKTIKKASLKDS